MFILYRRLTTPCCHDIRFLPMCTYFTKWIFSSTALDKGPCPKIQPLRGSVLFCTNVDTKNDNPPPKMAPSSSMVDCLVQSCGFTEDEAIKAVRPISHIKSPENAELVLCFLRRNGFGDADIRTVISLYARLLCADVEKTLEPKVLLLKDAGFSGPCLVQLVVSAPYALHQDVRDKIESLRSFLGTNERILIANERCIHLLSSNIDRVRSNITALQECGVAKERFPQFLLKMIRLVPGRRDRIKEITEQVQKFGFTPHTRMFELAFYAFGQLSTATVETKCERFRSLGFSEDELCTIIRRCPHVLKLSEEKFRNAMAFIQNELRLGPSYAIHYPMLLLYSMESRLKPRHSVLQALKSKGIPAGKHNFGSVIRISNESFSKKYVIPYLKEIPDMQTFYAIDATKLTSR